MDLSTIANCVGCYYRNHEKNGNEYRNGPGIFDEKFDELGMMSPSYCSLTLHGPFRLIQGALIRRALGATIAGRRNCSR